MRLRLPLAVLKKGIRCRSQRIDDLFIFEPLAYSLLNFDLSFRARSASRAGDCLMNRDQPNLKQSLVHLRELLQKARALARENRELAQKSREVRSEIKHSRPLHTNAV